MRRLVPFLFGSPVVLMFFRGFGRPSADGVGVRSYDKNPAQCLGAHVASAFAMALQTRCSKRVAWPFHQVT